MQYSTLARIALPLAAAVGLAACQPEQEVSEDPLVDETAVDVSEGELITRDVDPNEVPVDLPETEMTPASEELLTEELEEDAEAGVQ